MPETQTKKDFATLGLPQSVLTRLTALGFTIPTPIQKEAIPHGLEGSDLIGVAQTGTGKTLAFGLPMAVRLQQNEVGLVLAPTRELAQQIEETFQKLGIRTALLIGGAAMRPQISALRNRPRVIVATPGRLMDHLAQRNADLRNVAIAVLDEADRMLDMGFAPSIRKILDATPKNRQTMLFSATMPKEIAELARQYLRDPVRIEVEHAGMVAEDISQELVIVQKEEKPALLRELLYENKGTVLVFTRTRHGARKIAKSVRELGHSAAELHSDRTLAQRRAALQGFKDGMFRVLVATDIAARGIDVKEITLVINFDIPENAEDYIHRIGRTGRAGASGHAITLATPEQHGDVRDIEKLLSARLPISPRSKSAMPVPVAASPRQFGGGNRRQNQRSRFRGR